MAYEVTATRRRPQGFDSLAGQEFVAETLKNTIQSKKIAHAYLFAGPRGCGKTSTARILAKALNCKHGPTATPCGECENCREITRGSSSDVIEIDGASNTSVDDIRQIKEEVLFAPQSSRYKIYIIDEVHMLSTSAFNALLKTIEEPPEYVIFIFATTELQKVPATIKSRCQQFNFRLVPIETVEKLLADAAKEIGIKADDEALFWVARESTGSVRDAYTLFDQVAAFSGDHITFDKIRDKLGLVGVDRLNVLFEDCCAGRVSDAISKLDGFLQNGISIEQFISNAVDFLRSILLIKNGITKESLLGQSAERFSQNVISSWKTVQIERAISLLFQLYRDIRYSISPRYELELAISRLCWISEYVSPAEVKRAIDQAKTLLLSAQSTAAIPKENASAPTLSKVMNPLSWQRQNTPPPSPAPAPISAQKPLPVFDALKNLPEYQNAKPISTISQNSISQKPIEQNSILNNSIEQNENSANKKTSDSAKKNPPNEKKESPAPISIEDANLKKNALDFLVTKNAVLATKLMQTKNWRRQNDKIVFETESDFVVADLKKHQKEIRDALFEIFGQRFDFEILLKKRNFVDLRQNAPESVRLLCDTFRGEIVGVDEKSETKNEQNQADKTETSSDEEETFEQIDESDEGDDFD